MNTVNYIIFLSLLFTSVLGFVPVKHTTLVVEKGHDPCEACTTILQDVEDYIADPHTQDTIVSFIQTSVCSLLPADTSRTCSQEARVLVAQAIASMEQEVPPAKACAYLGMCHPQALLEAAGISESSLSVDHSKESFSLECALCKVVLGKMLERLRDPEVRAQMKESASNACQTLSDAEQAQHCHYDVDKLFESLEGLVYDVNSAQACLALQFCDQGEGNAAVPDAVVKLRGVVNAWKELPLHSKPETCETCIRIVGEAVAVLMDPENQKELLDFAKRACDSFEDYKDQCIEYVDMYGPMVIGIAISYLQPQPLCTRLGYCDLDAFGAVAGAIGSSS